MNLRSMMKHLPWLAIYLLSVSHACATPPNEFFAMDTIARGGLDKVVPMLKELGYAGLGGQAGDAAMAAALEHESLRMFNGYLTLSFDEEKPALDDHLRGILDRMQGQHGAALWLAVQKVHRGGAALVAAVGDGVAFAKLAEIADYAHARGVPVALYPHTGMWFEHVEDALRMADKLNRPDVGITFNLCHWLKVEGSERDPLPVLKAALRRLMFVTICGADTGDTKTMAWNRLIQPLGSGTYDVAAFMQKVHNAGYFGPVGFQGFGIKREPGEVLKQTMEAWKNMEVQDPPKNISPTPSASASSEALLLLQTLRPAPGDKKEHTGLVDGRHVLWGELFEAGHVCAVLELKGDRWNWCDPALAREDLAPPSVAVASWKRDHWELLFALPVQPLWRGHSPPTQYLPKSVPDQPFWVLAPKNDMPPLLVLSSPHGSLGHGHFVLVYDRSSHTLDPKAMYSWAEPRLRGKYVVLSDYTNHQEWERQEQTYYEQHKGHLAFCATHSTWYYPGHSLADPPQQGMSFTLPEGSGTGRRKWTFDQTNDDFSCFAVTVSTQSEKQAPLKGSFTYEWRQKPSGGLSVDEYLLEKVTGIPANCYVIDTPDAPPQREKPASAQPAPLTVTGAPEIVSRLSLKAKGWHLFGR